MKTEALSIVDTMKLALEALELCNGAETVDGVVIYTNQEITAIIEALSSPNGEAQPDPYKQGYADAMNWKVQNHLEHLPAAQPEQETVGLQWLAAMILSDCGCSTNNERLLERVIARIYRYERANSSPQRTWVGLTDDEIDQGLLRSNHALQTAGAWRDGVEWATKQLKEKNT